MITIRPDNATTSPLRTWPGTLTATCCLLIALVSGPTGCQTAQPLAYQLQHYHLDLQLDPSRNELAGRAVIDIERQEEPPDEAEGPFAVEVLLHPALEISEARAAGAEVVAVQELKTDRAEDSDAGAPRRHLIVLDSPALSMRLFLGYRGELYQDPSKGEIAGQIHNFTMKAHVGENGTYLGGGYWYPQPVGDEQKAPRPFEYSMTANRMPDYELIAGAQRTDALTVDQSTRYAWRTPFPVDNIVLVGGPLQAHERQVGHVLVRAYVGESNAENAPIVLDTAEHILDRYQPLIGEYPAGQYSIVQNFFSSGFAHPMFTVLSSFIIAAGDRMLTRHGYLDHEMLHSWWGNGVLVDPTRGNWCESITSYCTNYYGYVLDGNAKDARRTRRNYSHYLSRLKPEHDKPLSTYGQPGGCRRSLAYNKGAMVFHMLSREIGQETLWRAFRRLNEAYTGRYASWETIQSVCEKEAGTSLKLFFDQWVFGAGAPLLAIERATYHTGDQKLDLTFTRGDNGFALKVPVRVTTDAGDMDIECDLPAGPPKEPVEYTASLESIPVKVTLDPDYQLFRKVPVSEINPTTSQTRSGSAFASILPAGEPHETYQSLKSLFEGSFEEDERLAFTAGNVQQGALAERCLLILGEAVRDPYISAFLSAIEFPVQFRENGFVFDGVTYSEVQYSVLVTARHPGVEGGGVTVLFGNSDDALPPAINIPYYGHSLVIFENGQPVVRRDFEKLPAVEVENME